MDSYGLARRKQEAVELQRRSRELRPDENPPSIRRIRLTPVQHTILLLHRYAWTIAACTLIATSLSLLWAARQPRLYRATAKVAIYRDNPAGVSLDKDVTPQTSDVDEYSVSLETQLHILQSRTLALGVVRKLGLARDPEFAGQSQLETNQISPAKDQSATKAESAATDVMLLDLSVHPIKDTRVVEVSFTGPKPELDSKIVNTLVDGFIEDSIRSRYEAATRAAEFLSGQLADLRAKVEESQEKLVAYERAHNIVGIDEKQNVVTTKLEDLNKQLTLAEADRIDKESLYQTIVAGSLDQIPDGKSGEALQNLRLREAELKNEYAQTNTTYGPNYPKVLELTNRIKAMEASIQAELKRLAERTHAEYLASVRREQKLREAFNSQKVEANRLSESAIQYGLLKREVDSNRQLYDNLQQRMKEAGVAAGLRSSNIRVIDAAEPPSSPVSPNLPKSGSIGLFLGFLAGAAIIGVREGMNRSLRDIDEVESFTAMPALAVIPLREWHKRVDGEFDAVCLTQPRSAVAEAYRALGTSIMLGSPRLKTLLVTSSLPGEGKTVTAINSALVLAQQGKRVLLVDADLRKPTLHRGFGLANELGLSSLLLGSSSEAKSIIQHEQMPSLFVLSAGAAQPMAAELLGSSRMRDLMTSWRTQYDYVLLDTPPILAVTDAVRLSRMADSALLITRLRQTPRDALARTCDILNQERIPVLGIVVNGVNPRSPGSYYYGYYPELSRSYYHDEVRS
jgi:capsular exopolysaccharide synthesis family protein